MLAKELENENIDIANDEVAQTVALLVIKQWKAEGIIADEEYSRMLNYVYSKKIANTS